MLERYRDYRAALSDGYQIFLPNVPLKTYHFTNYRYGFEAAFGFNPLHPTSLLYEKQRGGYRLVGAMYTAPRTAPEDELNRRIPLSVAEWHAHVNYCLPPPDQKREMFGEHPGARVPVAHAGATGQGPRAAPVDGAADRRGSGRRARGTRSALNAQRRAWLVLSAQS